MGVSEQSRECYQRVNWSAQARAPRYDQPITEGPSLLDQQPAKPLTRTTEPLTRLRGAEVEVDTRRASRVALGACIVTLAVSSAVLFVVGIHKNDQIASLHARGVPVQVTVSTCTGLLGGSGSNAAGYACYGTFTLNGHSNSEAVPGYSMRAPGSKLDAIAVAGDPPLLDTKTALAREQTSLNVFVVPSVLLTTLLVLVGALVLRRRAGLHRSSPVSRPACA